MQQKEGKFIVFEGIDGAGKTTQLDLLEKRLREEGRKVFRTAEPTDSPIGKMLREALGGKQKRTAGEMAAMFLLDRVSHNVDPTDGIRKKLSEGYDVLCDRYYYSSLAYQGSETDAKWVRDMNLNCPEILRPDLCIFLDLTPEESMRRIEKHRTSVEIYENRERLESVRKKFFAVFETLKDSENIRVVDASGSVESIHEAICKLVR